MELCKLGIRSLPQSNAFLFCSACTLCTKGCPQNVRVHEIMQEMKDLAPDDADTYGFLEKGFDETLEALGREMPLPLVYCWICLRPPDDADDIYDDAIKKAFERAINRPYPQPVTPGPDTIKVAIVGSGPAGLTAAWNLAKAGLAVTIFESLPEPGGMLRTGIPGYRLPKDILDDEINRIKALGIEMRTDTTIEEGFFGSMISGQSEFKAVFIATGSYRSRKLGVEGEGLAGVFPAIDFLKEYNLNKETKTGKKVVVIGGGNVATDAAGAAVRCGAESVSLYCLEDRKSMPAHEWEIAEAVADGVIINPSWGPDAILGNGESVTGVRFKRCLSAFDQKGRFRPVFDDSQTQVVEADTVVYAIGQGPDLHYLSKTVATARGSVQADPYTMETNLPGLFAAGDAVSGTASLIEAIIGGRAAADSIIRYLSGE